MKHTAEPWFHNGKGTVHNGTYSIAVVGGDGLNALNNADRIVESVNALAGIPDPAAALTAAREALEAVADASRLIGTPLAEQARAALAALKGEQS